MSLRRRDLAGAIFALAVAALFVRLGVWQLNRLAERKVANAAIQAARALAPVELPLHRVEPEALRDRRAQARGSYDYAHERVWTGRTYDGAPGVALLTPLRLSDGSAVFVDRGWVPSPDAVHVDATRYREGDSADVTGLALPAPRDRGDVNPAALKDSLPYTTLAIVLQLDDTAAPHPVGLKRWRPPALDSGPHLSYAIQWFSFAAIVVVGVVVLLWKTAKTSREGV
ncbi:MAG TPA: SURF1 family protein [Gemmatimonadales bacterium]|jgi:surfeit locus 1 family protein|nr:SURF1 family protein [Gemmatimonadales bacterium]